MKHGDIVKVKWQFDSVVGKQIKHVLCVALNVTQVDIKKGTNASKPGVYLFRGYWYGNNPFNHNSYGKIEGTVGRVVGTVRNDRQVRKLKI